MGLFDQFPYTNFHELNLMWILEALKEIQTTTEQFVAINSLKYADPIQWNITTQYEKNTIVIDPNTGTAYISVQPVPMGTALSNTDYWTVVFDLGRFITLASQNFAVSYESVLTTTATMATAQGNWIVWNSLLYEALNDIHIGDAYIVDGNIKKTTVEEFYRRLAQKITDEIAARIAADNTLQGNINAEAQARQTADNTLQGNIDAEAQARQTADNAETQARQAADNAETQARQAADNTLQSNINAEITARQAADQEIYNYIRVNNAYDYIVDLTGSGDFTSLAACVANVPTGSRILVRAGVYNNEYVECTGKRLIIVGENRDEVIIQNGFDDYMRPPFNIGKGYVANLTIKSFGTGGNNHAYGMHIDNNDLANESLTIDNCYISSASNAGVGIGTRNSCQLTFRDCLIKSTSADAAAFFIHPSAVTEYQGNGQYFLASNCIFESNIQSIMHWQKVGPDTNNIIATFNGCQLKGTGEFFGVIYQSVYQNGEGKVYTTQGAGNNYAFLNERTFVPGQTIDSGRYIDSPIRTVVYAGSVAAATQTQIALPSDVRMMVRVEGCILDNNSQIWYPIGCKLPDTNDYHEVYFTLTDSSKALFVNCSTNSYYRIEVTYISNSEQYL